MGGNVKEAHLAQKRKRRKKRKKKERERLLQERANGEWMHLTVEVEGDAKQVWVKSDQSDDAVRAFAQDFLLKTWVTELTPDTRFSELKDALNEKDWIKETRGSLPQE